MSPRTFPYARLTLEVVNDEGSGFAGGGFKNFYRISGHGRGGHPGGEKRSLADKTVTFCVGVAFDRVWGSCGGQLVLVIGTEK